MLAFADVLHRNRGGNLTAEQLTQANVIRRGGRQLELIINDLLTMSRMSAGNFSLVITEFEISSMLKDVERMMQPVVAGRSQEIETICHVDGETMFADSARLAQALCNLVSNASRYAPPDTKITVEADRDGDAIALSVTDQGGGIPEDQRETIFSRLPRPQSDTARAEMGVGLGLRIVKALVEAHHGAVRIARAESGGARLIVRIPSFVGDTAAQQAV
jgi:signal transduction histidine kinase